MLIVILQISSIFLPVTIVPFNMWVRLLVVLVKEFQNTEDVSSTMHLVKSMVAKNYQNTLIMENVVVLNFLLEFLKNLKAMDGLKEMP